MKIQKKAFGGRKSVGQVSNLPKLAGQVGNLPHGLLRP
jgi:hypothetical protein